MTDKERLLTFLKEHSPPGKVLFAKIGGSRCHNLHKATSDYDFQGVFVATTSEVLSMDWSKSKETMTYDSDDATRDKNTKPDHTFHEVGKFCELLIKGNPGIVEMLFTESPSTLIYNERWCDLIENRKKFLTQQSVKQYLGYIDGQIRRIKGCKKEEGYKEKWVYHILRLATDAHMIAMGGEPKVWWEDSPERDELLLVREYHYTWGQLEEKITNAIRRVEELKPWKLPEEGDKEWLNRWLLDIRRDNW